MQPQLNFSKNHPTIGLPTAWRRAFAFATHCIRRAITCDTRWSSHVYLLRCRRHSHPKPRLRPLCITLFASYIYHICIYIHMSTPRVRAHCSYCVCLSKSHVHRVLELRDNPFDDIYRAISTHMCAPRNYICDNARRTSCWSHDANIFVCVFVLFIYFKWKLNAPSSFCVFIYIKCKFIQCVCVFNLSCLIEVARLSADARIECALCALVKPTWHSCSAHCIYRFGHGVALD